MSWQALNWCAALHHVKGGRRALLWAMANRHNVQTGLVTMGLTSLADESGLSRSAAHRHLKGLERDGLILTLIPSSGTRPAAYILPSLASHPDGTQGTVACVPPTWDTSGDASVPLATGLSDLASHSEDLASHPGGTKPIKQPEEQPKSAAATVDDDPTADAVVAHSAEGNGLPPDVTAALAALKATMHADLQAQRQADAQRDRDLLGPPATEPQETR